MRSKTISLLAVIIALAIANIWTIVAQAAISFPDEGPYITRTDAYQNVLESGDMLVLGRYNDPYGTIPDRTITQAYLARLMNGSTELARVSPYSYYQSGYGYGMFSMYLDAASAPAWEGAYTVELLGSPTLDWLETTATTAVAGAVADDGGVQTDETSEANSGAANDVTLLPATPAVNDAYYVGGNDVFSIVTFNIGQQGVGVWDVTWEYYDGDGWDTLATSDDTLGFMATVGNHDLTLTVPDNWAKTTVDGISAYWVRARVYSYTSVTTQPLGTQIWTNASATYPYVSTPSINWRTSASRATTQALLYAHLTLYAQDLGDNWNLALLSETATGSVLSSYGEAYFTNAIPELRSMCPNLFSSSVSGASYNDIDWQNQQSSTVEDTFPFDWSGIAVWLGFSNSNATIKTLSGFGIILILMVMIGKVTGNPGKSMMAGYSLAMCLAVPGWLTPLIIGGISFTAVLIAALVFIFGKTA